MIKNLTTIIIVLFLLSGGILFFTYKDMPIVRNSLVYANIVYNLQNIGIEFSSLKHAYNKPLGFAYLTILTVNLFGLNVNVGMKVISLITTALWGISGIFFFHRFAKKWEINKSYLPVFLLISFLNPLVFFQFISAYPDMLYALIFTWSLYFLDKILSDDRRKIDGLFFGLLIIAGVWVKHSGFTVYFFILVFLFFDFKSKWLQLKNKDASIVIALLAIIIASCILLYLQYNTNSRWFNLGSNSGNYLGGNNRFYILKRNTFFFFLFLLMTFSTLVPLLKPILFNENKTWYLSMFCYTFSLLYYHGTYDNIRYYIPLIYLFSMIILSNWQRLPLFKRKTTLFLFVSINSFVTITYNNISIFNFINHTFRVPSFDNLRLTNEYAIVQNDIELINRESVSINNLIFASDYYNNGSHFVWEKEGLLSKKLDIKYLSEVKAKKIIEFNINEAMLYSYRKISLNDLNIFYDIVKLNDRVLFIKKKK